MSVHLFAAGLRAARPVPLPLARCGVQAGFPSPADGGFDQRVDLNHELVRRPASTFVVRVQGDSMLGGAADLRPDDLLVVDRSVEAQPGDVVVAAIGGEFTVKRLRRRGSRLVLVPENGAYAEVTLTEELDVGGVGRGHGAHPALSADLSAATRKEATMIGVVDANAFYASCERVFDAALAGRAVAVLSNNDGCVIARSREAKALGIPMGAAWHEVRGLCEQRGVRVFSANFALYGDMSQRVREVLEELAPGAVEPYSIDECFLDLSGMDPAGLEAWLARLARTVRRWTGIPVSVGAGPTRTLAKIGANRAKDTPGGACVLDPRAPAGAEWLARLPVQEVWGIARGWGHRLRAHGVFTAAGLAALPEPVARKLLGVAGARIALELRGVRCLAGDTSPPRHSACCSRSFGEPNLGRDEVREAVATHAARAAEKIRRWRRVAGYVQVFLRSREDSRPGEELHRVAGTTLPTPTAWTPAIVSTALRALDELWQEDVRWKNAGVTLLDLCLEDHVQPTLPAVFGDAPAADVETESRRRRLMQAVDGINRRLGRDAVHPAATGWPATPGKTRRWEGLSERRSPCYTTDLRSVPRVRL